MDKQDYRGTVEQFADGMARVCGIYGINPLLGRLYGALYLSPTPQSLDDIAGLVGAAKSTVSVSLRKLESLKVVRRSWKKGDRRDYYEAVTDFAAIFADWLRMFILPEIQVGRELDAMVAHNLEDPLVGDDWPEGDGVAELRQRATYLRTISEHMGELIAALLDKSGNPDPARLAAILTSKDGETP
ncbi:MAG: hypothetical protein Tsb0020_17760 [Haliangiales bacterium]